LRQLASRSSVVVYTRDEKVPLSDDDREMECGWRMVPIPPTCDGDWIIVDERSDRATGWVRRSQIVVPEAVSRRH
jgi:hypothetical protein